MVNPWNRQDQKETYALQECNIKYENEITRSHFLLKYPIFKDISLFLSELLKGNGKSLKQLMFQKAKKRALQSRIFECNISNMKI